MDDDHNISFSKHARRRVAPKDEDHVGAKLKVSAAYKAVR
jgi:hypothetical protein